MASGAVLLVASSFGVMGTWASVAAAGLLTVGAFMMAIVMEETTAPAPRMAPRAMASSQPRP
jgi:hypothetical protein